MISYAFDVVERYSHGKRRATQTLKRMRKHTYLELEKGASGRYRKKQYPAIRWQRNKTSAGFNMFASDYVESPVDSTY